MKKPGKALFGYISFARVILTAVAMMIILCSCSTGGIQSSPETNASSDVMLPTIEPAELFGTFDEAESTKMMELINDYRVESGLEPYLTDDNLMEWARTRAAEIVILFKHERIDGSSIITAYTGDSATEFESSLATGYASTRDVINFYKENDTQRSRMLNEEYTYFGAACLNYNGSKYWTVVYLLP